MNAPAISLLAAVCGLGFGVVFVAAILQRHWASPYRWIAATSLVTLVVLAAGFPGKLKGDLEALNGQRKAYAASDERKAHERCLNDMGRPDLVDALAFARRQMPDGARYHVRSSAQSTGCLMLNLFPREPVSPADFDARTDWLVLDGVDPAQLEPNIAEAAQATDRRVSLSPSFTLIAPEADRR